MYFFSAQLAVKLSEFAPIREVFSRATLRCGCNGEKPGLWLRLPRNVQLSGKFGEFVLDQVRDIVLVVDIGLPSIVLSVLNPLEFRSKLRKRH